MIVPAEQLCRGDLIQFTAGPRALQPEHDDIYFVDAVQDMTQNFVAVFLLEIYDSTPVVLPVRRDEIVSLYSVQS